MPNDPRVVVDTCVAVSAALLSSSLSRQTVDRVLEIGRLLVSEATVAELDEVLRRRKFDRYLPEQARLEFLAALVREAEVVAVEIEVAQCRDPRDDKFLALALSGRASHIVSGDADLLVLHPFQGIAIVTPRQFLDSFPVESNPPGKAEDA